MKAPAKLAACLLLAAPLAGGLFAQEVDFFLQPVTLLRGDANGDFERDISDAMRIFSHLFLGGEPPAEVVGCEGVSQISSGDTNGDGVLDMSDGIHLISWLYLGGSAPAEPCSTGDGAGAGATTSTTVVQVVAVPPPQVNVCNGDLVFLSGNALSLQHDTVTPSGTTISKFLISWKAIRGTGIPSGQEYIGTGSALISLTFGPSTTQTIHATMRYISPGGGGNHHAVAMTHFTRNANGDVTVNISSISFECRGD